MTPMFPIIELVDRYAIAQIKFEKTQKNLSELDFYRSQMDQYNISTIKDELTELFQIHNMIWELEKELKSGLEHLLDYEEIGRRAIKIRDWNHRRIELKNIMADKLGQGHIHEIKQDHLSE